MPRRITEAGQHRSVLDPHGVKRRRVQAGQRKDRRGDLGCLGGRVADVAIALTGQHDEDPDGAVLQVAAVLCDLLPAASC